MNCISWRYWPLGVATGVFCVGWMLTIETHRKKLTGANSNDNDNDDDVCIGRLQAIGNDK